MGTVEFLGHAGLAVRQGDSLLLCDPWLSPYGAYNASWFPYPEYDGDLAVLLEPTAVYVSHEHLDHLDPWFLSQLKADVPILTGRFHKKRLVRKLRTLGFSRVIELDEFEPYEVGPGLVIQIATATFNCPPHWFDSCAALRIGNRMVLNLNDSGLTVPLDKLGSEGVDVLLAQASPAIWYPLTYPQYAPEERGRLIHARRESALTAFIAAAKTIRPDLAISFAGPPCFFDSELADQFLSQDSMFVTPPVAARRLFAETGIRADVVCPGDVLRFDIRGISIQRNPTYADFDYQRDRTCYFARHRSEKRRVIEAVDARIAPARPGLFQRFKAHFAPLVRSQRYFAARINTRVLFVVTGDHGDRWIIDLRSDADSDFVYEHAAEPCQYSFEIESRHVEQVLADELSWEDLFTGTSTWRLSAARAVPGSTMRGARRSGRSTPLFKRIEPRATPPGAWAATSSRVCWRWPVSCSSPTSGRRSSTTASVPSQRQRHRHQLRRTRHAGRPTRRGRRRRPPVAPRRVHRLDPAAARS